MSIRCTCGHYRGMHDSGGCRICDCRRYERQGSRTQAPVVTSVSLDATTVGQIQMLVEISKKLDKVLERMHQPAVADSIINRMRNGGVHLEDLLSAFAGDGESLATVLNSMDFLGLGTAQPSMPNEDTAVWDGAFVWCTVNYGDGETETLMRYSGRSAPHGQGQHREMIVSMFDSIELY